jgi:methylmalonyl-CoA mutase
LKEQTDMTLKLNNFDLPDLDAWRTKIKDETKSKKTALYFNEIEGLSFDANDKSQNQNFNTFRSNKINDWQIAANVLVKDEKKANKLALQCLGQGVNLLYLDLQEKSINWALLLKDIHLNFIRIVVNLKSTEQLLSLNQFVDDSDKKTFSISVDPIDYIDVPALIDSDFNLVVNLFHLEQIGAKASDQLSKALHFSENLITKMSNVNRIQFEIGIGSDFFIEIAKVRALKWLLNHLLELNNKSVDNLSILARSGWTNKSVIDTDTNILRQTTESISAISGGANSLLVHSPLAYSNLNENWFYRRLAINISHILKEESFLTKVNDPLSGSFLIEKITEHLITNSWNQFLEFNEKSDNEVNEMLCKSIACTREQKLSAFVQGEKELIGINLFPIEKDENILWADIPKYLGFDYLIYEKHQNG